MVDPYWIGAAGSITFSSFLMWQVGKRMLRNRGVEIEVRWNE